MEIHIAMQQMFIEVNANYFLQHHANCPVDMSSCIGSEHSGAAKAHQDKSSSHCLIKPCCMSKLKQGRSQVGTQLARECLIIHALIDGFSKTLNH